ncbi:hypothetical protein BCR36DRAFT_461960 [Piromyces finnis]|uniref:Uncharacterized protein n=1 Tax=Piromyces finnis TaxID=1754191 RepID=A0A1Y1UXM7_9FUNG|nr:hypothetical protein BCR36DRAFT_461960 [Piromyces finnis]|eukprot:ORX42877.1 hypothetical protein BCR36DRAFT_461960 [Piromyces finnis]
MNYIKEEKRKIFNQRINKLYSIKARNLEELPSIIRKIKNIFTSIEKQDTKIMSEVEKVKIIYHALPKYLQERMTISTKIKSDEFIEEVIDKHLMIKYLKDKSTISKIDNVKLSSNDPMDIDFISKEKIFNKTKTIPNNKYKSKSTKNYCYICETYDYSLDQCKFNLKNKNREGNKYRNTSEKYSRNQKQKGRNFKNNNFKSKPSRIFQISDTMKKINMAI